MLDKIHLGKWEEVMPKVPDNSIDLVATSPVYNVSLGQNKFRDKDKGYDKCDDNMPYNEYLDWMTNLFTQCNRVLKHGGRLCLDGSTLISSKRGLIKIQEIIVGDYVLTHLGQWRRVSDIIKSVHKSNLLIQAENSNEIKITNEHPIFGVKTMTCPYRKGQNYVCRKDCPHKENAWRKSNTKIKCHHKFYENYNKEFIKAGELSVNDFVLMPLPKYFGKEKMITHNEAYIYGLYLSEGWINKKYKITKKTSTKYFCAASTHFALHIKEHPIYNLLKNKIKITYHAHSGKNYVRGKCVTVNIYNTEFSKNLEKFGRGSFNKHIPEDIYYRCNIKDLLKIVIAFWYGDGSIVKIPKLEYQQYGNVASMVTVSPLLAMQLRDILYANGFSPSVTIRSVNKHSVHRKTAFNIILSGNDCRRFYALSKKTYHIDMYNFNNINIGKQKTYRTKTVDGYNAYKIKRITKKYHVPKIYYNLEVEGDNSYCLSNFAVHNCVNIGDGANGSVPTHVDFTYRLLNMVRFVDLRVLNQFNFQEYKMITTIVWDKNQIGSSTAWGSWKSPSQPSFPTQFEFIIVVGKGTKKHEGDPAKITVTKENFMRNSRALWTFPPDTGMMKKYDHPATFPEELPRRLIDQLTYKDDVVLDPFSGSGTTCSVAKTMGRHYIGIEMSEKYHLISTERVSRIAVMNNGAPSWML